MLRTIFPITLEKIGCSAPFFREIEKIGCSARFFEKKLDAPHDFSNYIGKNWMLRTIFS